MHIDHHVIFSFRIFKAFKAKFQQHDGLLTRTTGRNCAYTPGNDAKCLFNILQFLQRNSVCSETFGIRL